MCRGGFRRTHDHVFDLFEPFSAGSGHGQLLAFKRCIGSDSRHMNERQRICTPFGVMRCNHTRHPPGADFALIRRLPEHDSGLAAARVAIGKREVTMSMPAPLS
jgi:hypothetical protein